MSTTAQANALKNYRQRLQQRGMGRFEVMGLLRDRDLIRTLARRLAEDNADSSRILRTSICHSIAPRPSGIGGIVAALRRSPLVGVDLVFAREQTSGRAVDL
jgi:hypothetical protein